MSRKKRFIGRVPPLVDAQMRKASNSLRQIHANNSWFYFIRAGLAAERFDHVSGLN
jgi:hypothetical protein